MNKVVSLGLSIQDLSKTVIDDFWYDYVKPKYDEKTNLYSMDTENFILSKTQIIFIKTLQKMLKQDLTLQIMN